ncbi:AGAP013381-PA-like protein [Anopheles sinensis]|uniref:AGAP013381-PA-like protein n=1 Tax=Anopheles sinensis TaxID=74873 RepID=A0A084WPR9_ANOSI|nr:AGAP013381-PA-like protein [Anopheles sinensis]
MPSKKRSPSLAEKECARKSISGPIDDDSLKRLNSNIFGNSINYFCDLSQNKENFITTSSFYVNDDDTDDYCYSDFFMTSSITLSSRKIKKLPKIQNIANHPRSSQSMSFIAADVNAAYRNFSLVAEAPYNDATTQQQQQQQNHQLSSGQQALTYYPELDEYGSASTTDRRLLPAGRHDSYADTNSTHSMSYGGGSGRKQQSAYAGSGSGQSGSNAFCNHNPIYSDQLDNNNSTNVGALMLLNGELGKAATVGTKKQLPVIQPPSSGGGGHESLGYPYKPQLYPTSSGSGGATSGGRDELGGSSSLQNGYGKDLQGYTTSGGLYDAGPGEMSSKRPTLMNDRVTALKSRSRSSTPVSSSGGSSSRSDYSTASKQQSAYDNAYQGYDAMNHVTACTGSVASSSAGSVYTSSMGGAYGSSAASSSGGGYGTTTTTTTPKLLPKPVPSSGGSSHKSNNYLSSPDKKPPLRRSPDRVAENMYYDDHQDSFLMASSEKDTYGGTGAGDEPRRSSYDQHRNDRAPYDLMDDVGESFGGAYDDDHYPDDDHLPIDTSNTHSSKKLPKVGHGSDGISKKQLHFFDEREECFDEELEELEQANAAKQQQHQQQQQQQGQQQEQQTGQQPGQQSTNGTAGSGVLAGASASTNALLEHGYDVKADKLDQLNGVTGSGANGAGGAGLTPGTGAPGDGAIVTDISKDITQQQGKRENFNARDKWLWAYDQIINNQHT